MGSITLKLFGAFGVFLGMAVIISVKIREKKKGIGFVTDFISSLKYIEDMIMFSAAPFCEVLLKVTEASHESKDFFICILNGIKNSDNPTLYSVWERAADYFAKKNQLSEKTTDIIKRIGSRLGTMDAQTEAENISFGRGELTDEKNRMLCDFEKESKLLKSLTMAIGGFVILIFI